MIPTMSKRLERELDELLIEAQTAGIDNVMWFDDENGDLWLWRAEVGRWEYHQVKKGA